MNVPIGKTVVIRIDFREQRSGITGELENFPDHLLSGLMLFKQVITGLVIRLFLHGRRCRISLTPLKREGFSSKCIA